MAHTIIPYLSDLVKRHLISNNLVIKRFSREIGVPYMVVYRLSSGEQKGISFLHSKKLLRAIEPAQYLTILGKYFAEETEDLLAKGQEIEDSSDELLELAEFAFTDYDHYRVLNFATESLGAKRENVAMEFGRLGIEILDRLLERKAIDQNSDGTFKSNLSQVNFWDRNLLVEVGHHNLQLFSNMNPASYLRNWTLGLSESGVKKYYDAHTSFVNSLKAIEDDSSLKGTQVMSSSVLVCPLHSPQDKKRGN